MTDPNITELKIDVEYLDREREMILDLLAELKRRLDAMDKSISTERLEVDGKITAQDIELIAKVTNQSDAS